MRRILYRAAIAASMTGMVMAGTMSPCHADPGGSSSSTSETVKGDVLNIEGEFYVVKDKSGHEVRLHVTPETRLEDRVKVGDKIEAQVTREGQATNVRVPSVDEGYPRDSFR
jgi:hypothetical protein